MSFFSKLNDQEIESFLPRQKQFYGDGKKSPDEEPEPKPKRRYRRRVDENGQPRKKRTPNSYALFVKENYDKVKGKTFQERSKRLSKLWRKKKKQKA